jgi:hypothetical protein
MTKPDARAVAIGEIADYLAKHAQERDVAARNCAPGSDQRNWGLMVAREIAQLAEQIREMA